MWLRLLFVAAPTAAAVGALTAFAPFAKPRVVTVTARDYAFEAPDSIAAGLTTLKLVNLGKEYHHLWLARLEEGKTLADLFEAVKTHEMPRWTVHLGGPNAGQPGDTTSATVRLAPGRYALLCFIPSSDGVPHLAKGMVRELTVTGTADTDPLPAADVTVTLTDYDFVFAPTLTLGRHTLRLRNTSRQVHEMFIARLKPGKTTQDLLAVIEKGDPSTAAVAVGGVTGIAPGEVNDIELNVTPGDYVLLCFVPDATDGKLHIAHGMVKEMRIQ